MPKQRLDLLLVELNLCDSRQQAQRLIRAGEVKVNQQVVDKPGTEVDPAAQIQVRQKSPYVSRGGRNWPRRSPNSKSRSLDESAWMEEFLQEALPIVCYRPEPLRCMGSMWVMDR